MTLLTPAGNDLTDSKGHALHVGQLVEHDILGEGTVRGTVPLEKGADSDSNLSSDDEDYAV